MGTIVYSIERRNDDGMLTSLEIKLKFGGPETPSADYVSLACIAFANTTLYDNNGQSLNISLDKKRANLVDIIIKLKTNDLTNTDLANFKDTIMRNLTDEKLLKLLPTQKPAN